LVKRLALTFDDGTGAIRSKLIAIYSLLILANIAAWAGAWAAFAGQPVLLGTAVLAYVFGLRHAVDADHIAAIDNVVRKLMQEGKKPIGVGLFFSLGHSTVVVVAVVALAIAAYAFQDRLEEFRAIGGMIGTSVSAVFLLAIGVLNLFILRSVWRTFQQVRHGARLVEEDINRVLGGQGLIARLCRPLFQLVTRSWHMYPLGLLFGLGFDTATEVGLLAVSANQAAQGMSIWSVLLFPALFVAGMSLVDTTDSVLMVGAYGWAFVKPIRKLWYNMTITAASVAVALFIGGLEALGLISEKLQLSGGLWDVVGALNDSLANFGFAVIAIFAAAWALSVLVYRWKGYENAAVASGD